MRQHAPDFTCPLRGQASRDDLQKAVATGNYGSITDRHDWPLLADSSRPRKVRNGPRTTIKIPTQTSESLTFPAVLMRPIVHLVAQNGDFGFGDPRYECEGRLLICRRRRNRKTAVLWRLRAGDLRVCRLLVPGSPTCAQLPPYSFGDDLLAVSSN